LPTPILPAFAEPAFAEPALDAIADALSRRGYAICPAALDDGLVARLEARLQGLAPESWRAAGTGRQHGFAGPGATRHDKTAWLSADDAVESEYLRAMEILRCGLNRRLFLGLFDYESHFSIYPAGGHYTRHLDALAGRSNRAVSAVLYLNERWDADDGGELLLYADAGDVALERIFPRMGTLVLFLSTEFPHEVTTARRERHSLSGWFRVNSGDSSRVDPAR
jgi:SM-20-related protein